MLVSQYGFNDSEGFIVPVATPSRDSPWTEDVKLNGNHTRTLEFPPAQALLTDLLSSSLILKEDFEKLPDQTQDDIRHCSGVRQLLPLLVQHGLLTDYQASRIEAGKTYGLILGNYRVLDRLGAGGMGVVFKGEHVDMRRPVAIKVLSMHTEQDSRIQQRFRTEIRVVAQLQHPNIVAAMDAGTVSAPDSPSLRYFVMEHVPGQDLEEFVKATGPRVIPRSCGQPSIQAASSVDLSPLTNVTP